MLNPREFAGVGGECAASGSFVTRAGERYYVIRDVDSIPPFLMSIVSGGDHWLFVSSTGGLTAGRESPDHALFPYLSSDKIHDSATHTGSKTILRVATHRGQSAWEPFNAEHDGRYDISRNLYKNVLGNKLQVEEVNHDLGLAFRHSWETSGEFGFVRGCELENRGDNQVRLDLVDGLQNLLPAGTPRTSQARASNLVNAYKWTELFPESGLVVYSLYSGISDRAEPRESLRATTAFSLGFDRCRILLSSRQLKEFRAGRDVVQESGNRGIRGAYLVNAELDLAPGKSRRWQIVADVEQSQADVARLREALRDPLRLASAVGDSVSAGDDALARIVATADGMQVTAEENVTAHHVANTLFNVLRGGIFADQYRVECADFVSIVRHFNVGLADRCRAELDSLPETLAFPDLLAAVQCIGDPQLERLCREYLPITFGRRHGDPSRPWNDFRIRLTDAAGRRLIAYEGNWRDIFQNWEALAWSYPEFVDNFIAKFVNASTRDGYNPYCIARDGIDWEIEDPGDPWSNIGYWGDHQIVYLLKFLELSRQFHPERLAAGLHERTYCYANVPYRIRPFAAIVGNPKDTLVFDQALAAQIEERVARLGADGKLVLDGDGNVLLVNLLEKLLVPFLAKLGNLVVDGGIWLNTQRPEWNDANNALVGHGLSLVTLCYMRRYAAFLLELLDGETRSVFLSAEVAEWLERTAAAIAAQRRIGEGPPLSPRRRVALLSELGEAAAHYREAVYRQPASGLRRQYPIAALSALLGDALGVIDASIGTNRRDDGLYHAYNVMRFDPAGLYIEPLYLMLEGQVAALSSGAVTPDQAVGIVETLFASDMFRPDQKSFMLYPDRPLPGFLDKNRVPASDVEAIPLLERMIAAGDERIVHRDASGCYRFNADFANSADLADCLDTIGDCYAGDVDAARDALEALYERVFCHRQFTGRSGTMFGFEGLGSIYWHMVAKLLLAIAENFFAALERSPAASRRLGELYYRVRDGLGFNKTPAEFGAFPTDPYSHTPRHSGARQPGMTGQVKEELLCRLAELGVRVTDGALTVRPALLRRCEFPDEDRSLRYLDVTGRWQRVAVAAPGLAFTWCQVPIVYRLSAGAAARIDVACGDGRELTFDSSTLPAGISRDLFARSGSVARLTVTLSPDMLYRPE